MKQVFNLIRGGFHMVKTTKVKETLNDVNFKSNNSKQTVLSSGIAVTPAILEVLQIALPIIGSSIKEKLKNEIDNQKNVREDQRNILSRRAEQLLKFIELEENKDNYDQKRIDQWKLDLEMNWKQQSELDNKNDGFLKFIFNKFIN